MKPPSIAARRALQAKAVRSFLLTRPEGATSEEITAALGDVGSAKSYLRNRGFARMSPANAKANGTRGELWFAASPPDERAPDFVKLFPTPIKKP